MTRRLHLTNGKAIVPKIRGAGIDGQIVAWDDVLHEGPVPAGLGPAALRERRADFLASWGGVGRDEIARAFEARDAALDAATGDPLSATKAPPLQTPMPADEIVLWFEHDLFDQLHLLQILDRLPVDGDPRVTAVAPATYLGHIAESDYPDLYATRRIVSSAERMAARDAWQAFRSVDPRALFDALPRLTAVPQVGPALVRHAQQFPSTQNGLSRTEQQTLEVIAGGVTRLGDVFVATNQREEAMFMGDAAFMFHLSPLIRGARPLLEPSNLGTREPWNPGTLEPWNPGTLEPWNLDLRLTPDGEKVLAAAADRVALCGIDRWLGGVYLSGTGPLWRWDTERRSIRFV